MERGRGNEGKANEGEVNKEQQGREGTGRGRGGQRYVGMEEGNKGETKGRGKGRRGENKQKVSRLVECSLGSRKTKKEAVREDKGKGRSEGR